MTLALAQQIGRWWAAQAGLTFVEPESSAPGHVYACPLPRPGRREATAASISIIASAGAADLAVTDVTQRIVMVVEAHADTLEDAMSMLHGLRGHLRGNDKPFVSPSTQGVIGLLDDAAFASEEPVRGWRVIGFELVNEPVPLRFPGDATPDGQSSAQMTIAVVAHRVSLARAFDVINETSGLDWASVEVDETHVVLATSAGGAGDATVYRRGISVSTLAAAIDAAGGGWATSNANAGVSGLDAGRVIGFGAVDVEGSSKRLVVMTN